MRRLKMDSVMGVRREVLARFLAALVLVMGIFAASANAAYARHGADDGPYARHGADDGRHHHRHHHHHHHHRHGGDDGPLHR
jgi:hypothetical protein